MNFHVVFKLDGCLQQSTPRVEKEAVAIGMYKQLCHDLSNGILENNSGFGYVQLYAGNILMREFECKETIIMQAPAERTAPTKVEVMRGVLNDMRNSDRDDCV